VFGDLPVEGYGSRPRSKRSGRRTTTSSREIPAKLGKALVQLAAMESPPKQFFAGSDAVNAITADLQARLSEAQAHKVLSVTTDGNF